MKRSERWRPRERGRGDRHRRKERIVEGLDRGRRVGRDWKRIREWER